MARAKRICKRTGCGKTATHNGWCDDDARAADLARGTRHQRGYGSAHDADRERLLHAYDLAVAAGIVPRCWRCGQLMLPGQSLAADHSKISAAAGGRADVLVHLDPCNSGKRRPGA
jgi:hypothetical protein